MTHSDGRRKKLYKDPNDRKIAGVASGVAKYFDIDTTLVRAVWIVLALGGFGILLYVVLWVMLDDEPADLEVFPATEGGVADDGSLIAETEGGGGSNP